MNSPLRSVLAEPRPSAPPVRVWRDWLLLTVVLGSGLVEGLLRPELPVISLARVFVLAPLLLWRRTHPFAVVALTFGVITMVDVVLLFGDGPTHDVYALAYVVVLPYSLFRWGSGREAVWGAAVMAVPAVMAPIVNWTGAADAVGGFAVWFSCFALGWAVRSERGARERRIEQVKAEERVLLARELHDTVAHHVSAIAIRAQVGRALAADTPSASLEALEVIEVEASRTLAEMRTMVRVLRNEAPADYAPQPGVADLERLAGATPAGTRVALDVTGDVAALPTAIDAAVYRIAQEAVTNALRHARNASLVEVCVDGGASTLSLVVRDDGDPVADSGDVGFGLTGMVERAQLVGGTCQAGPCPGRGWAVRATLPRKVPG